MSSKELIYADVYKLKTDGSMVTIDEVGEVLRLTEGEFLGKHYDLLNELEHVGSGKVERIYVDEKKEIDFLGRWKNYDPEDDGPN